MASANRASSSVRARKRVPLGRHRLIEQLLGPGDRAVQPAAAHRFAAHPPGALAQVVESTATIGTLAQQRPQRIAHAGAGQYLGADGVHGGAHVIGGRERVRPTLPRAITAPSRGHRLP